MIIDFISQVSTKVHSIIQQEVLDRQHIHLDSTIMIISMQLLILILACKASPVAHILTPGTSQRGWQEPPTAQTLSLTP